MFKSFKLFGRNKSSKSEASTKGTPYYKWSVAEVASWAEKLKSLGSVMRLHRIDGARLTSIHDRVDFASMGITKVGHQMKLYKGLRILRSQLAESGNDPFSSPVSEWSPSIVEIWIRSSQEEIIRKLSTSFISSNINGDKLLKLSDAELSRLCNKNDRTIALLVASISVLQRQRRPSDGKELLYGALNAGKRQKKSPLLTPLSIDPPKLHKLRPSLEPPLLSTKSPTRNGVSIEHKGKQMVRKGLGLGLDFGALRNEEVQRKQLSTEPIMRFSQTGTFTAGDLVITPSGIQKSKELEAVRKRSKCRKVKRELLASKTADSELNVDTNNEISPVLSDSPKLKKENKSPVHRLRRFGSKGSKELKEEYCLIKELGRGAGATVFKAVHLPTLRVVAIKRYRLTNEDKIKQVMIEANSLMINHCDIDDALRPPPCQFMLGFYGAYSEPTTRTLNIILEYMDGGVLQDMVDIGVPCDEPLLAFIALHMLRGLKFLHTRHYIHRDIKPHNVLVNRVTGEIKVADMGIAKKFDGGIGAAETFTGTIMYMSPERLEGKPYSYDSDIWSVGLTILTLAQAKMPFDTSGGFWGLASRLRDGAMPNLPESSSSKNLRDFISCCLQADPTKRSSSWTLLEHKFLLENIPKWKIRMKKKHKKSNGKFNLENNSSYSSESDDADEGVLGSTCIRRRLTEDAARSKAKKKNGSDSNTERALTKASSDLMLAFRSKVNLLAVGGDVEKIMQGELERKKKSVTELQDIALAVKNAWAERNEEMPKYSNEAIVKMAIQCGMPITMAEEEASELFEEGLGPSPNDDEKAITFIPK